MSFEIRVLWEENPGKWRKIMYSPVQKRPRLLAVATLATALAGLSFTSFTPSAFALKQANSPSAGILQAGPEDTRPPRIDAAAKPVLDQVEKAYKNLNSASIAGTVTLKVDVADISKRNTENFTSSFERPNKFRHELKNLLLGSDGTTGYAYDQKQHAYMKFDMPKHKEHLGDIPDVVAQMLQTQNPSLLFALTQAPITDLATDFSEVKRLNDHVIDNVKYSVLQFGSDRTAHKIQLLIDPQTHLVRRFILDFTDALQQHASGQKVKSAVLIVDYTRVTPDQKMEAKQFAWTPPDDALDVKEAAGADNQGSDDNEQ
jgi:outer membrane lipoprotein-sorting protein